MPEEQDGTEREQPEPTRVLLVEDEAIIARWLQLILGRDSQESRVVSSLADAGAFLRSSPDWPDLIYVDLTLPDGPGVDFIQEWLPRVQAHSKKPMWLAASGYAEDDTLALLERLDVRYLPKPFNAEVFLEFVRESTNS